MMGLSLANSRTQCELSFVDRVSITTNSYSKEIEVERRKKYCLFNLAFCFREQGKHVQDLSHVSFTNVLYTNSTSKREPRSSQLHFQTSTGYFIAGYCVLSILNSYFEPTFKGTSRQFIF